MAKLVSMDGKVLSEPNTIPPEVMEAARTIEVFFASRGISRHWEMGALCSRFYAICLHAFVPKLKKLHQHPNGDKVIDEHNKALKALRGVDEGKVDAGFFKYLEESIVDLSDRKAGLVGK